MPDNVSPRIINTRFGLAAIFLDTVVIVNNNSKIIINKDTLTELCNRCGNTKLIFLCKTPSSGETIQVGGVQYPSIKSCKCNEGTRP